MGPSSWLRSVKRALKSQTTGRERNSERDEEYRKKREKERWIFGTPPPYGEETKHREDGNIASSSNATITRRKSTDKRILGPRSHVLDEEGAEQRRAFAVAMATSAATEAAVATARAAVEVIRLATPSIIFVEYYAAVMIQAAFRGYLARRALRALKGVVKLQAFIRGCIVRKRTKMTLQYMQSLLRVQSQVCHQRKRLSTDSNFSPLKHFYQVADTKSNSRHSTSSVSSNEVHPHKSREAKLKRESSLAYAFSRQEEEKPNPRERNKAVAIDTWAPENRGQNLLINSIASPHRSRIRTLKAQSREREEAEAAAREGEREICGGDGLSCKMERLSFAGSDSYI